MASFERSEIINAAVESVFQFAVEPDNHHLFMPDTTKIEKQYRFIEQGAYFFQTREFKPGKYATCKHTFAVCDTPNRIRIEAYQKGLTCAYELTFTEVPDGTKVDLLAEAYGKWFWKPMLRKVIDMVEKADGDYVKHLKSKFEEQC